MKERLNNLKAYVLLQRPFTDSLSRIIRFRAKPESLEAPIVQQDFEYDPAKSEYLADIDSVPGELDEDYLDEPKKSAIIEFAANFGKDIIHLPAKPKGRILIGVGVATMLIAGAKIIYDHHARNQTKD